jgi:hypothetical protein
MRRHRSIFLRTKDVGIQGCSVAEIARVMRPDQSVEENLPHAFATALTELLDAELMSSDEGDLAAQRGFSAFVHSHKP